jgi:hypothetical protein
MGEQADYLIDDMMLSEMEEDYAVAGVQCKYCKRGPFWWQQDHLGIWRLYTEKLHLHKCNKYSKDK